MFRFLVMFFVILSISTPTLAQDHGIPRGHGRLTAVGSIDTGGNTDKSPVVALVTRSVALDRSNACLVVAFDNSRPSSVFPRVTQQRAEASLSDFATVSDNDICEKDLSFRFIIRVVLYGISGSDRISLEIIERTSSEVRLRRPMESILQIRDNLPAVFLATAMNEPSNWVKNPRPQEFSAAPGQPLDHLIIAGNHWHGYKNEYGVYFACPLQAGYRTNKCAGEGHSDEACVDYKGCREVSRLSDGSFIF